MDPPVAKWWMVIAVLITIVRIADASEPAHPLTIDLQMRNDARIPAYVVDEAQKEVTRIFAEAGLALRWTDAAPKFAVHIVQQVLGYARAGSPVMGVAQRTANGSLVQVFFKQVHDFARAYRVDLSTMLAYVIAHEVGHLLLPGHGHSPTGLMQAGWDEALVRDAARRSLTFSDAQAARIRAGR